MWAEDSIINKDDIAKMDRDTLAGARLVSKYMNILSAEKKRAFKLDNKKKTLTMWLQDYYMNGLYTEELKRRPSPKLAKTKDEAQRMMEIDATMVQLNEMILESDSIILLCKEVIEYIRWNRTKDIKNYIDYIKWNSGQL